MKIDAYTRGVLTIIAARLLRTCVKGAIRVFVFMS